MKFSVISPETARNGSINCPCLYSFDAKDETAAAAMLQAERAKYSTRFHKDSRLYTGGVFWKYAELKKREG